MSKTRLHNKTVYILKTDHVYSEFNELANELKATNFINGKKPNVYHLFRVMDIGIHTDGTRAVALIKSLVDDTEYLIDSYDLTEIEE